MGWKNLDDMELDGKRVLVRVDINVPVENGKVTDATRIRRVALTIRDILDKGGRPILLAHFGRPKGRHVPEMSLQPLVPALEEAFGAPVSFCADCRGPAAQAAVDCLADGSVLLLENTRFYAGEE
ncbi:phosphoglycerate kinase, partial [Cribrihabitans sp. XS_ASV171]